MREPESSADLLAEWLKLRGCLYDPITRLPALPLVLDDVRRRLEGGEAMGLVYLDLSGGGEAETAVGWQGHDEAIRILAATLRRCHESLLQEQDVLAQLGVRSDKLLVFVGLSPVAGAPAGRQPAARLEELYRAILEAASAAFEPFPELNAPLLQSACLELSSEPQVRIERSIYQAVAVAHESCRRESRRRHSGRFDELRRILVSGEILIRYQPIVDLESGLAHGYEALSSALSAEIFENTEVLFSFAEESEGIVDLERLCRRQAVERLPPVFGAFRRGKLFLNCSTHAFGDPRLVEDLLASIKNAELAPAEVVLEVTERTAIKEWQTFRRKLDEVRESGLQIAIDDMGSGYSSLHAVGEIEPEYLKFDGSLIRGIHTSAIKRDLFETLVTLAEKIGARPIAEGIEQEEELEVVKSLGVGLGQGYFFARPAVPEHLRAIHFPARSLR